MCGISRGKVEKWKIAKRKEGGGSSMSPTLPVRFFSGIVRFLSLVDRYLSASKI